MSWLDEEREWLAHLPSSYADFLISICDLSGISADGINLVVTLIWSAIFGWFWQHQRHPLLRQLTSTIFSILILYHFYGPYSFFGVIAIISGAYPVFKTRNVTLISLYAWAQNFLVFIFFWWFYCGSFRMDISTTTMGLLVRLHFIAYDQQDMDRYKQNKILSKDPKIQKYRMQHKLDKELSFYDFFSYQVCFLHIFAGSNMTTMDYFRLIDLRQFKDCGDKIPQAGATDCFKLIVKAAINCVLYLVLSINIFRIGRVYEDGFMEYNVFLRSVYLALCVIAVKQRYHFVWHLVELPILTTGAGYSGKKDGIILWENHKNIHSWKAEFGEKEIYLTFNWNITVNIWLKHYFLDRLENKSWPLEVKLLLTRAAGSLFHGVYTGPHMFFFCTVPHSIFFTPIIDHYVGLSRNYKSKGKQWVVYIFRLTVQCYLINSYGVSMVWFQAKDWVALNNMQFWIPHLILILSVFFKTAVVDPARSKLRRQKRKTSGLKVD